MNRIFGADPTLAWRPAATCSASPSSRSSRAWRAAGSCSTPGATSSTSCAELLRKLHQLGAAFYRTMSAGEIMSRSTSDLQQVRMLFGFGVLNVVNVVFAFASALQVMLAHLARLTLACLLNLPLVAHHAQLLARLFTCACARTRRRLGKLSDVLQANLAGVRVVRSFALESGSELASRRPTASTSRRASRSRGSADRWGR
jgi:ABC-type multidrug transport system fused ATPase/permease subunit